MAVAVGELLEILPDALVLRETLIAALDSGAALANRFYEWREGHVAGSAGLIELSSAARLIDKDTLRDSPRRPPIDREFDPDIRVKYTSGTTGTPVGVLYDKYTHLEQMLVVPRRIIETYHAPVDADCALEPLTTVAVTDNQDCSDEIWIDPWGGVVVQLVVDETSSSSFHRAISRIRRIGPRLLTIKPSLLEAMMSLNAVGRGLSGAVDYVSVSGSDFRRSARVRAECALGVPIIEAYGMTEFGLVGSACSMDEGLHIDAAIVAEVYDVEADKLLPRLDPNPQDGELVLSSLRNTAMPLIRYRTGDMVTLDRTPCLCGRRSPRLSRISGRLMDCFQLVDGRKISPSRFNRLFRHESVSEMQVVQKSTRSFVVNIEPKDDGDMELGVIDDEIRGIVGSESEVEIRLGRIQKSGKFQRYLKMFA